MTDPIIQLIPITEFDEDMLVPLDRNLKELVRLLGILQVYENKTGKLVNISVGAAGITLDGVIPTASLSDKLIGLAHELQLANEAVTTAKLAVAAVIAEKIAEGAVTEAKIAVGAITRPKIADEAVNTDKIADAAITAIKLAQESVNSAHIYAGAVTSAKIAASAVMSWNIESGQITVPKTNFPRHQLF